jgi:acyl carrier protein
MDNKKKFLERFQSIFDETNPNEIVLDTKFKELEEWGSLMILSLIVLIDDEYNYKITPTEIEIAIIVEDLYNLLNHH